MRRLFTRILARAGYDAGAVESGTGKELLARPIQFSSPRRDKPFIVLNCAALC